MKLEMASKKRIPISEGELLLYKNAKVVCVNNWNVIIRHMLKHDEIH